MGVSRPDLWRLRGCIVVFTANSLTQYNSLSTTRGAERQTVGCGKIESQKNNVYDQEFLGQTKAVVLF